MKPCAHLAKPIRITYLVGALLWMVSAPLPLASAEDWPPAPQLERSVDAPQDAAPLPTSIVAEPQPQDHWKCTFRFRPESDVKSVALAGSFNNWDRQTTPLAPTTSEYWTAELDLPSGVYQYKFLVNNEQWFNDPLNTDQVPDGYGGFNSFVRLGRLARLTVSDAKRGDGQIDVAGLKHQNPLPLYVQSADPNTVILRYRTLTNDVDKVWLALKGQSPRAMEIVSAGPLFTYWETRLPVPPLESNAGPEVWGFNYTFIVDDGAGQRCDPYLYHYTHVPTGLLTTPTWARDAVWYQIITDRFRNGDPSNDPNPVRPWTSEWFAPSAWEGKDGQTFYQNFVFDRFYGGDIAGVEAELPYLKELGVSALYFTPVFVAPSYHKYDVTNYLHIDDGLGVAGEYAKVAPQEDLLDLATWKWTASDRRFLDFLRKAHEQGFKVIIDGVFNHVGAQHPAFVDVQKNGQRSRYADWFDVISWEPFAYKGWAGFAHMPVFAKDGQGFASPTLKKHLFAVTRRWMDPNGDGDPSDGIDGWRLDVPNDIPLPFWAEWRQLVKQLNPNAFITGEVWNRADQWLDGRHFDSVMNYEFAKTAVAWVFDQQTKIPASAAAARFAELRMAYPEAATVVMQNLLSSHDTDRLVSMAFNPDREYDRSNRVQDNNLTYKNERPDDAAYARARLAALLQVTYVGAPLIYYGDEVGMWGADDPSNRKPMLWKDLEPYEKPEENHVLDAQLAHYKQILALHNAHSALREGDLANLLADDAADVWAFMRSDTKEHVIVVLNASAEPREVHVPLPKGLPAAWRVIFGGDDAATAGEAESQIKVRIPALGGVVLQAKR